MRSVIDERGIERYLGNVVPVAGPRYGWTYYGDVPDTPMVPRSRWGEVIARWSRPDDNPFLPPVHDQDGIGCCNASATVAGMEACRAMQGLPHVSLSAGDLYRRICGGSDNGSLLEDGLAESIRGGVASARTVPYLDWRRDHAGAADERRLYRVTEAFVCPTFEHVMSAALSGFYLISGVMWHDNYRIDGDGWLPKRGSGGGGGHAVLGYAPAERGGAFGVWHQNSWSADWGARGRCVFPEEMYRGPVGGWWAVRAVVNEPGDTPGPRG